ncbi:hypothetical protein BDB01DRAFT_514172 [Pilobolus umbonatus]|nr:hypothetical protein BDB01DRAFT_514172 [Pilobolus umbonatus]
MFRTSSHAEIIVTLSLLHRILVQLRTIILMHRCPRGYLNYTSDWPLLRINRKGFSRITRFLLRHCPTWKFNPTALHRLFFLLPPIKPLVLMTHLNNSTSAETRLSINVPESKNITKPSYSQIASSPPRALIKTSRKAVARTFIVENKERISSIRSKFHKLGLQSSRHLNIY